MGLLLVLVFISQYQTTHMYIVSNHSLLIYNWTPIRKFILHSVRCSIQMSADTDAVHHQIVTNSTVVRI